MGNVNSSLSQKASPAEVTQAFFVLASTFILGIQFLPADVRSALMDYGARRPNDAAVSQQAGAVAKLKDMLATLSNIGQVPHSWFRHFYMVSVGWSLYWATQFLTKGKVIGALAAKQAATGGRGMALTQVYIAWLLMSMQGSRRLYETFFVSKMGKSPMWVVHWALALAYYTAMGTAVWIEGSGAVLEAWKAGSLKTAGLPSHVPYAVALFVAASLKQNECHAHLASLKKYTLPSTGMFKHFICPHYTCECALYFALALAASPRGAVFNKTVLSGLLFVTVNLGATAYGTKQWYIEKFGAEKVGKRWMMIPYIW